MWPFGGGIPPLRREGKSMSEVHVKDGESLENALKRFKRSCAKSGVLAEVRKREPHRASLPCSPIGWNSPVTASING